MRTFKFALGLDFSVIVPESFIQQQLDWAGADDATEFQQGLLQQYKETLAGTPGELTADEAAEYVRSAQDAFCMALLKNGIRKGVRGHVLAMLESSGLGGRVSPVGVAPIEIVVDKEDAVK